MRRALISTLLLATGCHGLSALGGACKQTTDCVKGAFCVDGQCAASQACKQNSDCAAHQICTTELHCASSVTPAMTIIGMHGDTADATSPEGFIVTSALVVNGTGFVSAMEGVLVDAANKAYPLTLSVASATTLTAVLPLTLEALVPATAQGASFTLQLKSATAGTASAPLSIVRGAQGPPGPPGPEVVAPLALTYTLDDQPALSVSNSDLTGLALSVTGNMDFTNNGPPSVLIAPFVTFTPDNETTNTSYNAASAMRLPIYQVTPAASAANDVSIPCHGNDLVIGGGCQPMSPGNTCFVTRNYPISASAWHCRTNDIAGVNANCTMATYAICLKSF